MKKAASRGRPRKKWDRRENTISVKLTDEEKARFEEAADAARKTLSDFIRQVLAEAADRQLGPQKPTP